MTDSIDEEHGYIDGIIGNITVRKTTEENLRRSEAALKGADRRKDEFIAMLNMSCAIR